jgi:hypothetical protein
LGLTVQSGHFRIDQGAILSTDEDNLKETVSHARSGDPGGVKFYDAADWTVSGALGVGTESPGAPITIYKAVPYLGFYDTSTGGSWDWTLDGYEDYFALWTFNGGNVFEVDKDAPQYSLYIGDGGQIGLGTAVPADSLHLIRDDGTTKMLVEEASGTTAARTLYHLKNRGRIRFTMENTGTGKFWSFTAYDSSFAINHSSSSGAEFRLVPSTGNLEIKGEVHAADFVVTSDRDLKEAFAAIDSQQILDKVANLPITEWEYKADRADTRHLGPVAQDFRSAFGLGKDDRHINAMDGVGVSLAAIKGLCERLEEKDAEIEYLKAELAEIKAMLRK